MKVRRFDTIEDKLTYIARQTCDSREKFDEPAREPSTEHGSRNKSTYANLYSSQELTVLKQLKMLSDAPRRAPELSIQ